MVADARDDEGERHLGTMSAHPRVAAGRWRQSVPGRFKRAPRRRVSDLLSRLEKRRLLVADDEARYRVIV